MPSSLSTSDLKHTVSDVVDSSSLNLDEPDTVQTWTSQSSTWTAPSSVQDSTNLSLGSMEVAQDSIPGDNIPTARTTSHENDVQSQIKRKKNKTKNCEVTLDDYLSLTSPSEFFGVIQADNAAVHIDRDICPFVEPQDSCFIAFVFPSTTTQITTPPPPEGTVDPVTLPEEYSDLKAAFSDGTHELPEHGPHNIEITLENNKIPPLGPLYSLSDSEQKIVEKYVKDMMDKGLIRPSKSPCGAPILFARKKDGSLRLCVDYRKLNQLTVKNVYPLPLIDELLDRLHGSQIFSSLDLTDAYWLLRIAEGDEWKTAFRTRYGLFEYLIMPFGLSNAPGNFQAYVNSCFSDMIDKFLKIYMDDFLIHSKNIAEHVPHVQAVLNRVIEKKIKINLKKCTFHITKTAFLGYEVSSTGVNMLLDCVKTILSGNHLQT